MKSHVQLKELNVDPSIDPNEFATKSLNKPFMLPTLSLTEATTHNKGIFNGIDARSHSNWKRL